MRSRISIRGCVRPSACPLVTHELKPYQSAVFVQNYYQYERGRILCRVYGLVKWRAHPRRTSIVVCLAYQKFVSFHLKPFEIGNFVETGFSEISLTIILFWLKMLFDLMIYSRPAGFQRLVESVIHLFGSCTVRKIGRQFSNCLAAAKTRPHLWWLSH